VLALCGMPALWADVCDGLPTRPPDSQGLGFLLSRKDIPPALSFQLSVKRGGPRFRITVRSFPLTEGLAQGGEIEVARCQDGKRLQLLPIMNGEQRINFAATFSASDINFDGYLDFSVLTGFGQMYSVESYWVYAPGSGLFVQNELTQELGKKVKHNVDFDPKKHEISMDYHIPGVFGYCGFPGDRYRVENNRLILIHKVEITEIDQGPLPEPAPDRPYCTVTVSDLVGGTMRVTAVGRFDAQGKLVKGVFT